MKITKYLLPFFFLSLLTACVDKPEKEAIRPVFYEKAAKAEAGLSRTFPGVSRSAVEVKLGFKERGVLKRLEARTGDLVEKGYLIAVLEDSDYRLQLNRAVAARKRAAAQLREARSASQKTELLYEKNSVSLNEFERSKVGLESAERRFKSARHRAGIAAGRLSRVRLVAPFGGRVSRVFLKVGEVVAPGAPAVILASDNDLEVKTAAPESILGKIKKTMRAEIDFSALPNQTFAGEVVKADFASGQAGVYPVIVKILPPNADVRPGMAAEVRFSFQQGRDGSGEAVVAPANAVGQDGEDSFVFVISKKPDGRLAAQKRIVRLGKLRENGFEVKKGLKAGELIVTAGLSQMYDGRQVTLLEQ